MQIKGLLRLDGGMLSTECYMLVIFVIIVWLFLAAPAGILLFWFVRTNKRTEGQ